MNRCLTCLAVCLLGGIASAQPRITGILNNASYARTGLQGSGIAQGSIFAVFGENMAQASLVQYGFPLPTATPEGTSLRISVGGTGVNAFLIYTSAGQLAAVLPSNTPVGNATATVTYNGQTSATFPFNVVARSFGIFAINGAGTGAAVLTDANFGVITPTTALLENDVAILWGTGLGAVLFPDNQAAQVFDLKDQSSVEVFVGNRRANIRYAGRSSCCAGLDQLVIDVPAGTTGCNVSVVVRVSGQISNFTTTAIGTAGRRVCSEPGSYSEADLSAAAARGSLRSGSIVLSRGISKVTNPLGGGTIDSTTDNGGAAFVRFDYRGLISRGTASASVGDCSVVAFSGQGFVDPIVPAPLDAGAALSIRGSVGTKDIPRVSPGVYGASLGGGIALPIPGAPQPAPLFLNPGAFTVTGPGGADVGPINTSLTIANPFNWTNQDAINSIPRNIDLQLTWTGGASNDLIIISGASTRTNPTAGASFVCTAPASAGRFSVPAIVLSALPPSETQSGIATGSLALTQVPGSNLPTFTASGLDFGYIIYNTSYFKQTGYN
jgi:uncharacterized protein (TIGR03437 family)